MNVEKSGQIGLTKNMVSSLSIILPAKNEAKSLATLLPALRDIYPGTEIIVVDDGSHDETAAVCRSHNAKLVSHPYSKGNGAAVKTGARVAGGEVIVLMDADGQHQPDDIERLLATMQDGHDMVVGARQKGSQASIGRSFANRFYNLLSSWMVGQQVADLTSGFRAARADRFREFLHLLPNGFSYPTTITMAFFRAGYSVSYVPIVARKRVGHSHIRPVRDALRFLLIIFKVGTLYSPLKMFVPISGLFFVLGLGYYGYTFVEYGRFTNMSALLFITSILVFLIGLVSEQITTLVYKP